MAQLGGWTGYDVVQAEHEYRGGQSWRVLRLQAVPGSPRQCSRCGAVTRAVHDHRERRVRDLPIFQHRVELIVPRLRVACDGCGPK
ncbi:transposase family protein [Ideonella sp. BN130291]|uniref:transposase family protein n=1 Tax=Ideonella sp. BN130291 TaxID=3112940 RepID=UPI003FA52F26